MGIARLWHQESFQGKGKKQHYFEGWYFKLIDRERRTVLAVIPGVSIGKNKEEAHAFVQVIDAVQGKTAYYRFPFSDFRAAKGKFEIRIGNNRFSDTGMVFNLRDVNTAVSGSLRFSKIEKYPRSFFSPGIMGPFSFVPGMECYHGVVNISHVIHGNLTLNGIRVDMDGGEGYIEKDRGRSFPDTWIWLQANHFGDPGASFMFSVARIPWLGRRFTGLISFVKTPSSFYRFATYNGSRIRQILLREDTLDATLTSPRYTLIFRAQYDGGGILKAPKNGMMDRDIEESITAEVTLRLEDRRGNVLFEGNSPRAGMEKMGTLEGILPRPVPD